MSKIKNRMFNVGLGVVAGVLVGTIVAAAVAEWLVRSEPKHA